MSNTRRTTPRTRPQETITFMGNSYRVARKIGIWPQMQLARAAQEGVTLGDMRGLAAVHATLENVIDPEDWPRFEADMISGKCDDLQKLLDLVSEAAKVVAARQQNGDAPNGTVTGEVVRA